jgi:hypothetical protein
MAARGIVPLPSPGELVTVLYQLAFDADTALAGSAIATVDGLPEKVLAGAVADAGVDVNVLDWLSRRISTHGPLMDALLANAAVADETIAHLAGKVGAREIDAIAQNERRLLRHPEIIGAMYTNPKARMSTVDRAVELAVRNQVRVPGLAVWDEVARAIAGGAVANPEDDAAFAYAATAATESDDSALTKGDVEALTVDENGQLVAQEPEVEPEKVPIDKLSIPGKIRLATLGNAFARAVLVRDPLKMVAMAAIKSPGVTDMEAARYASNSGLCDDVIRYIAGRREWTRLYGIKLSLVCNPKTPLPEATKILPVLREKDLRNVAKSKGVPTAVAAQALKLAKARAAGGKK